LALSDLHPNPLAFNQSAQPGACCDVLSPSILPNETESLVGFVYFHGPNAFRDLTCDLRGPRSHR
jgi:hypothetical protein